jgi:WD40 repeat protein
MNIVRVHTAVLVLGALAIGCEPADRTAPIAPVAGSLMANVESDDAPVWSAWSAPVNLGPVVNSPYNDQHPAISKDGLSLYISSDRPGGFGGTDIWVLQRASLDDPWGSPENLGPNINSAGNDLAPTFTPDGHSMYFHSNGRGGCGLADIFVARRHDKRDDFGWEPAENLGCVVNSQYADAGPTYFTDEATGVTTLYFTVQNNPPGSDQGFDIYASTRMGDEGPFGPPVLVPELSSPFRDTRTTISRDGLEMFLSSGRPGNQQVGVSAGSEDLWVSTRATTSDVWSPPVNLNLVNQRLGGPPINGPAFDGAPALSFDGTTLYFFSERPGGFGKRDLYVTTRHRNPAPH